MMGVQGGHDVLPGEATANPVGPPGAPSATAQTGVPWGAA
jgi:hypothetical protein